MAKPTDAVPSLAADPGGLAALKAQARTSPQAAAKAVAQQFEAVFTQMMLKSMRDATPQEGLMDSPQTKQFTSLLDQQLSKAQGSRGLGLAALIERQLTHQAGGGVMKTGPGVGLGGHAATGSALPAASHRAAVGSGDAGLSPGGVSVPGDAQTFHSAVAPHAEEASRQTGIPASFLISQAALESGWGRHELRQADGSASHNVFGIKAGAHWTGKTVTAVTTEFDQGVPHKVLATFRAYDSYTEAFTDYARLLQGNPRYSQVLASAGNAQQFASGLQKAGYATDPHYADKLMHIMKQFSVA